MRLVVRLAHALDLQLILPLGVEELPCAVVIRLGHEDVRFAAKVAVIGQAGIGKLVRGCDACFSSITTSISALTN